MTDLRNISLPFAGGNEDEDRLPRSKRQAVKASGGTARARIANAVSVSLPEVPYLHLSGDRTAAERNELLSIASEAQGHADLALTIFEADRVCSWLSAEQRVAVREQLRALNLLAMEAHMRASGLMPLCPGPLPIRRLCAHLIMWRDQLPYLCWRLSLQGRDFKIPRPAEMDDNMPSLSTRKDVFASHAGLFEIPERAKKDRLVSNQSNSANKTFYRPEGAGIGV